ncbi:hypothetical protein ACIBF1_42020 [Spirillospora sp. NPDC050679]
MADETDAQERLFESTLEDLGRAYAEVLNLLQVLPADQRTFDHASALMEMLREFVETAADERAHVAARIAEAEKLSLAGLADRIGVSRARAGQLMQSSKKARQETTEGDQEDA